MYDLAARMQDVATLKIEDILNSKGTINLAAKKAPEPRVVYITKETRNLLLKYIGNKKVGLIFKENENNLEQKLIRFFNKC